MNTVPLKDFKRLADYFFSVMEGDTHLIEDAYTLLKKYNLCDADGFPIGDEDE